jgi:NAD-dependent dihydropyrimidine dehydrogenase PreA subunit
MARDIVRDVNHLWDMKRVADDLRQHHCMFAESKVFEKVYILELSYWTEGMPITQYQKLLKKYGLPALQEVTDTPQVIKTVEKDIPVLGVMGLKIIPDIGERKTICFEGCLSCSECIEECPENALYQEELEEGFAITIDLSLCDGVACRRCERACSEKGFDLLELLTAGDEPLPEKNEQQGMN